ncbi:MAG: SurA N-terminal domain-containing protein [Deltaproteobacteria bacterium]|nr:SurA N-terminal domain-containing protein [Candidatus Tharpella sp.]
MKRKILPPGKIIFIFFLIVFALSIFPHLTQARIVNRIMAIVGNQVITSMNLRQAISVEHHQEDFKALPVEEQNSIIKKELDGLIDDLLIAQKAASLGISITDEDIEATIERVLKQNRMNQEMLEKALASQNLNFTSYRNKIASDLLKAKFVSREVKTNIIITNEEVLDYAEKHDLFSQDDSVTLAQIFIPNGSPNAASGKDNEIWKKIRIRLKNEENFFTLASEFSEGPAAAKGGRLGTFKRGNLLAEIEEVAYKQPLGEASKVIITSLGNHMIMITNRTGKNEESALSPSAEEQIKDKLYEEKLEKALKNLGRDLRREYSVKIMQ